MNFSHPIRPVKDIRATAGGKRVKQNMSFIEQSSEREEKGKRSHPPRGNK